MRDFEGDQGAGDEEGTAVAAGLTAGAGREAVTRADVAADDQTATSVEGDGGAVGVGGVAGAAEEVAFDDDVAVGDDFEVAGGSDDFAGGDGVVLDDEALRRTGRRSFIGNGGKN
ncbi:MAG: hypothetical protein AB7K52_00350 [Phycisphaerales bacterium]